MRKRFSVVFISFILVTLLFSFNQKYAKSINYSLAVSHSVLDFHQHYQDEIPNDTFYIFHFWDHQEPIKGTVSSSAEWIQLSSNEFKGLKTEITVTLILKSLSPGKHEGNLTLDFSEEQMVIPVRVEVTNQRRYVAIMWDNPRIILDDAYQILWAAPYVKNGLGYLPLRPICEMAGIEIQYNAETRQTTINHVGKTIILETHFDESWIIIDGRYYYDKTFCPEIRSSTTFLPIEFFQQILHLEIVRNNENRFVMISQ